MIHTLVVAVPTRNVIALLKKFATRRQRKVKAMRMREDLLNLLRKMEVRVDKISLHNSYIQNDHAVLRGTRMQTFYLLLMLHSPTTISIAMLMPQYSALPTPYFIISSSALSEGCKSDHASHIVLPQARRHAKAETCHGVYVRCKLPIFHSGSTSLLGISVQ